LTARDVVVVEVGPRDGLQNEAAPVTTADKVTFVRALTRAGLPVIECGAFVRPDRVPQMADSDTVCRAVLAGVAHWPEAPRFTALVPNVRGLARAIDAGLRDVGIFAAASDTFSRRNINQSIDASLTAYAGVCADAARAGVAVRGYVSTAFGCPFEGPVSLEAVRRVSRRLLDLGVYEVVLSDTIGVAHPGQVRQVLRDLRADLPVDRLALHMHDTRGTALANVLAALDAGVRTFDASAGGLGGCPFAPGAAGNLATEDLIYMLDGLGMRTGVDLAAVAAASQAIEPLVGHPLPSRMLQAMRAGSAAPQTG
jgi:hydroxymethylglutaryl-CoA lyase